MSAAIKVNDGNFEAEVLKSGIPVLVDFWAEWCGPCKMLAPTLDQLSSEMAGKLKIVKVDVDQNRELAAQFGIRSIPTLLVFKGGTVKGQMIGAMNKAALVEKLGTYL